MKPGHGFGPEVPETLASFDTSVRTLAEQAEQAVAALPHAEIALAAGAFAAAREAYSGADEPVAAARLDVAIASLTEAGQSLKASSGYVADYIGAVGGRAAAGALPAHSAHTGAAAKQEVRVTEETIARADEAQAHLQAQPKMTEVARESYLSECGDDVLCELIRRDVPGAKGVLVLRHLPYMHKIARILVPSDHEWRGDVQRDDLVAAGVQHVLQYAHKYKGTFTFLTYMSRGIRGAMAETRARERTVVVLPEWIENEILAELTRENRRREDHGEREMTPEEIAERFGLPMESSGGDATTAHQAYQAYRLTRHMESLSVMVVADQRHHPVDFMENSGYMDTPRSELYADNRAAAVEGVAIEKVDYEVLRTKILEAVNSLPELWAETVKSLYGLDGRAPMTQREIAEREGCSHQNIGQRLIRIRATLARKNLEQYLDW